MKSNSAREIAATLRSMPPTRSSSECLDADAIAALADGKTAPGSERMIHVADCADCCFRLAAVARLLSDATIEDELAALHSRRRLALASPRTFALGSLAAAAVAAIVMLAPSQLRNGDAPGGDVPAHHRDPGNQTLTAPAVAAVSAASLLDSLRWTGVPEADLYRVRIWDGEGTVVWSTETRPTTLPLPSSLTPGILYLWDVSARTGWDRWVSSELAELSIRGNR